MRMGANRVGEIRWVKMCGVQICGCKYVHKTVCVQVYRVHMGYKYVGANM